MKKTDKLIANTRLVNQMIAAADSKTPEELVGFMGGIQSQDFAMAEWAVGLRLKDTGIKDIESSLDKGSIIRIHILRPTWHFVAAEDVRWMLRLSAPRIKASMKARHVQLDLPENIITKTNDILVKSLSGGKNLPRPELSRIFASHGIRTDENRLSHLLICAELDEIVCSGPLINNKLTYSLLSERVKVNKDLSKDEAMAELASRYFNSRTPATISDFAWWSNLSLTESRRALNSIRSGFKTETIGSREFILSESFNTTESSDSSVFLLPAFDEYLISYKDRSSSLPDIHNRKAVSVNGIFYPPLIVNGQVAGVWQRNFQKDKVFIRLNLFKPLSVRAMRQVHKQAEKFGNFLDMEAELRIEVH